MSAATATSALEACPSPESIKLKGVISAFKASQEKAAATSAKAESAADWRSRMAETASSVEEVRRSGWVTSASRNWKVGGLELRVWDRRRGMREGALDSQKQVHSLI